MLTASLVLHAWYWTKLLVFFLSPQRGHSSSRSNSWCVIFITSSCKIWISFSECFKSSHALIKVKDNTLAKSHTEKVSYWESHGNIICLKVFVALFNAVKKISSRNWSVGFCWCWNRWRQQLDFLTFTDFIEKRIVMATQKGILFFKYPYIKT